MNTKKLKLIAATAGTAGVLSMGVLTAAFSGSALADPATPGPIPTPEPTLGETTTDQTAPETTPTTPSAVPEIVGPAEAPE